MRPGIRGIDAGGTTREVEAGRPTTPITTGRFSTNPHDSPLAPLLLAPPPIPPAVLRPVLLLGDVALLVLFLEGAIPMPTAVRTWLAAA